MAYSALTASTVDRESMGSLTLHIATFASVDSGVWVSKLPNAVTYWASGDSGGGIGVSAVNATAGTDGVTFLLTVGEGLHAQKVKLYVGSRT